MFHIAVSCNKNRFDGDIIESIEADGKINIFVCLRIPNDAKIAKWEESFKAWITFGILYHIWNGEVLFVGLQVFI